LEIAVIQERLFFRREYGKNKVKVISGAGEEGQAKKAKPTKVVAHFIISNYQYKNLTINIKPVLSEAISIVGQMRLDAIFGFTSKLKK